jgi:hypothetical protein
MTLRTPLRQNWKRFALVLPPVVIAIFAMVVCQSTGNGLWAQASKPPAQKPGATQPPQTARPAPTPNPVDVQRLVSLKTKFTEVLDQELRNPPAATTVHEVISKRIGPFWFEENCWKWETNAKAIPLTHAELQEFRDVTARQIDEAIKLEQAGKGGAKLLGETQIRGTVISGKLRSVGGAAPLKPMSSQ